MQAKPYHKLTLDQQLKEMKALNYHRIQRILNVQVRHRDPSTRGGIIRPSTRGELFIQVHVGELFVPRI